ncbi:MAG: hypothetical protein L6Q29_03550 [Candidatus Pacebacteria bacterium]|nr:hypothetical protein [Candidatus Paceibacterota bacterium]
MFFTKKEIKGLWILLYWIAIGLAFVGLYIYSCRASELSDLIEKEKLYLPSEAEEIVKNNHLVPVMACRYPNRAGLEKIIVIDYLKEEDSQKLFLNSCERPNIKATAVFDTQKKVIVFCFYDEWGKKCLIRKVFL